jgi:hypothetical protein
MFLTVTCGQVRIDDSFSFPVLGVLLVDSKITTSKGVSAA